jgi:hypothetical protein
VKGIEMYEVWKLYPGSIIEISNLGNARNFHSKRPRKLVKNHGGYYRIEISTLSGKKTFSVHRMVSELFIPVIEGKHYVNHKDGIKTNNAVSNLEWVTPSENTIHALDTGLKGKGSTLQWAKLTESLVIDIKTRLCAGELAQSLAKEYGVSPGTISNLKSGRAWKGIGPEVESLERVSSTRKLAAEDIPVIRDLIAGGSTDAEIGLLYGTARGTIYRIRIGKNWINY